MAVVSWPSELLRHLDAQYFPRFYNRSAGRALNGREQIIGTGNAIWDVMLSIPRDFDSRRVKQFEAAVASMNGRANVTDFAICSPDRFDHSVSPLQTPHSDGTWFEDGFGYAEDKGVHPVTFTADAPAGSNVLTQDLTDPVRPSLRVGDEFSHQKFLHRVTAHLSGGRIRIEPSLRVGIAAGEPVAVDPPVIRLRFASDDEGRRTREYLRYGAPVDLRFVEVFDR
ncbi:hypothetical protein [Palleronia caenipelagi]|uniref:Uncharacterized protein n=1 Tax=Palleronia caenipelagi TaxID=2489174 RepID=A0A547Q6C9_9RHOB|nr:hypothetical protein [Palleronia caenipelagi]TRD21914.1 hypothetical protein FEV53_07645 [Palleronia caenipelagi]